MKNIEVKPVGTGVIRPKVSVIMPAYNVGGRIDDVLNMLIRILKGDYEIIIVDDGSQDPPTSKLLNLNDRIKLVKHSRNMGKGAAVKTGVNYARGKYAIIIDADGDICSENLEQYITALESYDVIVGSKRHPKSLYQAPLSRKILSLTFNKVVKLLVGIKLGDTQTGLKAFKTKHLKTIMNVIVTKRYAWDVEALLLANLLKLKIAEAPVRIKQDSMFKTRAAINMLIEVLAIFYRYRILHWYQKNLERQDTEYKLLLRT